MKIENDEFLYHYTSSETLELILKNKTICFNNLLAVNDKNESKSLQFDNFGKMYFVSCWTNKNQESIPMWNMYADNMRGVRIKMPKYPFEKYHYKKGECFSISDADSFIDYKTLFIENKVFITPDSPKLYKIEYTNEYNKIYPNILKYDLEKSIYSISELGKYKGEEWSFENEYRYLIKILPIRYSEIIFINNENVIKNINKRMQDDNYLMPIEHYFLNVRENVIDNIEVMLGPKVSKEKEIYIKKVVNKYCKNGVVKKSNIDIR